MKNYWIGILLLLAFIGLSSGKDVYLGSLLQKVDVHFSLFFCFIVSLIYFNFLQRRDYSSFLALIQKNYKVVTLLNFSTVLSWVGAFYALKFLEPAIAVTLMTSTGPLITILFSKFIRNRSTIIPIEIYSSIGIALSTVVVIYFIGEGYSGKETTVLETILGVGTALISGSAIVLNTLFSKHLLSQGWSPQKTLAVRYFLLVLLTAILTLSKSNSFQIGNIDLLLLFIVAIIGFIIPQISLQTGIAKVEAITVAMIMAIYPLVTFGFQLFDGRLSLTKYSAFSIVLSIIFILLGTLGRHYYLNSKKAMNEVNHSS